MVKRIPSKLPKRKVKEEEKDKKKKKEEKKEEKKKEEKPPQSPKELKLQTELRKLKGKIENKITFLIFYKLFAIPVYILILKETISISDIDFLDKSKKFTFIFFNTSLEKFLLLEILLIFFIHSINLFILDSFFQLLILNKAKINSLELGKFHKRFLEGLRDKDLVKFIIYMLNVFLPLILMVFIMYKMGKTHKTIYIILPAILTIFMSIGIITYLYRNLEIFDFGKNLDRVIWIILYLFSLGFIVIFSYTYFVLQYKKAFADKGVLFLVLAIFILIITIVYIFIFTRYIEKSESLLNLGAMFLPIIVDYIVLTIMFINFLFVILDYRIKGVDFVKYFIPKLSVEGTEFNELFKNNGINIVIQRKGNELYIFHKDITEDQKKLKHMEDFVNNLLPRENILLKKTNFKLRNVENILTFKNENFKFDSFINIYAELSNLINTKIDYSVLAYSIFNYSFFSEINFNNANLHDIDWKYSLIKDADFTDANLVNTNFSYSTLVRPIFNNTDLRNVNFKNALLVEPVFIYKDEKFTKLGGINWKDAILINPKLCWIVKKKVYTFSIVERVKNRLQGRVIASIGESDIYRYIKDYLQSNEKKQNFINIKVDSWKFLFKSTAYLISINTVLNKKKTAIEYIYIDVNKCTNLVPDISNQKNGNIYIPKLIETALILIDDEKELNYIQREIKSPRFYKYLNRLSNWYYNKIESNKNFFKNNSYENKIIALHFLYTLNYVKNDVKFDNLNDMPYNKSLQKSAEDIYKNFKKKLKESGLLRFKTLKKGFGNSFIESLKDFRLTEEERKGIIILLIIFASGTALCYFCRK